MKEITKEQSLLKDLVETIQVTGGLTRFSDGLCAPTAALEWTDLGEMVSSAQRQLASSDIEVQLDEEKVAYSSKEIE